MGHQRVKSWVDRSLTGVTSEKGEFQVTQVGRRMKLKKGPLDSIKSIPCNTHNYGDRVELIAYRDIEHGVPRVKKGEGTFLEELVKREPSFRDIF